VEIEKEATVTVKLPPIETVHCDATFAIDYTQRDSMVSVDGTIENKACAASRGEYKLAVSTRDEHGELQTSDFLESWQREDDQPVRFKRDYPIGKNVDIVRVRPVPLACSCTDKSAESATRDAR
jgi:hypothetical protein